MTKIIVSYRRSDSSASAGRIFDRLTSRYGDDSVFMDVDNIPFGIDFRTHIQQELLKSDILVAVIGPRWFGTSADGQHRIGDATDPVRVEVETALRNGVPVLPVLVDGATMPGANQLPDALKELAFINAAPVDMGRDFRQHMERLTRSMDGILASRAARTPAVAAGAVAAEAVNAEKPPAAAPPEKRTMSLPMIVGGIAAVLVVAGGGFLLMPRATAPSNKSSTATETSGPPIMPSAQPIPAAEPLPERRPVIAARPRMEDSAPGAIPAAPAAPPPVASAAPALPPPAPVASAAPPPSSPNAALPKSYRVLSSVSEGKLNMRGGPGTKYPLVTSIPAGATGIAIAGRCRMPDDGGSKPWCEATWRTYSGWVSSCCVVDEKTGAFPP